MNLVSIIPYLLVNYVLTILYFPKRDNDDSITEIMGGNSDAFDQVITIYKCKISRKQIESCKIGGLFASNKVNKKELKSSVILVINPFDSREKRNSLESNNSDNLEGQSINRLSNSNIEKKTKADILLYSSLGKNI